MNASFKDEASRAFFEKLYGNWSEQDQADLELRCAGEPGFATAYAQVARSWGVLGNHAEAPEIVVFREEALSDMRRTTLRRWSLSRRASRWRLAATVAGFALLLGAAWQLSPYGWRAGEYRTKIGELRLLELEDRSRIAIDSATKLQVDYSSDARVVRLLEGQAEFSVARDPARPFKVQVGDRTIVAVGTSFTVEYFDRKMSVAMLEGRVVVLPAAMSATTLDRQHTSIPPSTLARGVELNAGEALKVRADGQSMLLRKADIEAATAWREGKIILRTETLGEAVRKMNRYSRVTIEISDPSLAEERISGVFEAGNSQGFIDDVQRVLAIDARQVDARIIELRRR